MLRTEPKLSLDVWIVKAVVFALAVIWDFRFMVFLVEFLLYCIYSSKIFKRDVTIMCWPRASEILPINSR